MKRLILLLVFALSAISCEMSREMEAFSAKTGIRLEIKQSVVFAASEDDIQLAFNRHNREFRAQTDDMSDWFCVQFERMPHNEGDEVKASVSWTSSLGSGRKNKITLRVLKTEGDTMWLWEPNAQTALTIRILE